MAAYLVRRLVFSIPLLFGVVVVVFLMTRVLPGDPARAIAGPLAPQQEVERLRVQLGLDQPLWTQFQRYTADLVRGDLGTSLRTREPVITEIFSRLPNTLTLIVLSLGGAVAVGVPMGVAAATSRKSWRAHLATVISLFGISMPVFWSGLLLILLFAVNLRWLPAGGFGTWQHALLPCFTLGLFNLANVMRVTRSSMLEVLDHDYVRTANAKGLAQRVVVYKHALKNASIPVVTAVGVQFGQLLGGTVLTETVYAWPGIGRLMVDSIFARDYTVLQGTVLIFAVIIIVVNLLTDLTYGLLNPRIRYQ